MIISFAWTTPALLAGVKTMTRRDWDPGYARRFKSGMLVDAYDRSPRARGKKVATIRITRDPYLELVRDSLTPEVYEREGFNWLYLHGHKATVDRIVEAWETDPDLKEWVIEFELVDVVGATLPLEGPSAQGRADAQNLSSRRGTDAHA